MGKYLKVIGIAFGLLVLSLFIPSETVSSIIYNVVYYGTSIVLMVLLMRHTPSWVKWAVVGICIVMPFYVYFFEEIRFHWKYHIYISSVGFPTDWEPSSQRMWIEHFLDCVYLKAICYSMGFLIGFKVVRGTRWEREVKVER